VILGLTKVVQSARELVAGGIGVLAGTLRTDWAIEAIHAIAEEVPEAIAGAGTVINREQLKAVTDAGAKFAISPGMTESLLQAADQGSIPLFPGIATVSEL
ncbi:keto-deoxy-phosphogluconate aldolase, partial [Morganella morganii]|nr:keto-deoxy-phosphogluconate aldolase [Morganella morganii]